MPKPLRILCVHGVGQQEANAGWRAGWSDAIQHGITAWSPGRKVEPAFLSYDDLFARAPLTVGGIAVALGKLLASGVVYGIGDFFARPRGLKDLPEKVRWTAGMVVQWVENERLRAAARTRLVAAIESHEPDAICAHSLGSLIAYDALVRMEQPRATAGLTFVSLGSQIGNAFVRGTFGGRLVEPPVERWRHLWNRWDHVFTAPIRLVDPRFEQVDTPFDVAGMADHDAIEYLSHPATLNGVWRELAGGPVARTCERCSRTVSRAVRPPERRALLVGINEYPAAEDRLDGCVNDVFLMSSLLQECGFRAEEIRVVLDRRATTDGILERLEWLLDSAEDGAERVFFYSGHGAQLPVYAENDEIERVDECLVPVDFDWSREKAITDDRLFELYSQLPYGARFVAILDCCHSGGMARQGGPRVRGISPPDDVRHRMLRWDTLTRMWVPRDFRRARKEIGYTRNRPEYTGESGAVYRLGRSVGLRRLERAAYVRTRRELGHKGPYMPVILEACHEGELSYEYRHGVQSYGAFTYSLGGILRDMLDKHQSITFERLCERTRERLHDLEYAQTPEVIGPRQLIARRLPWLEKRGGVSSPARKRMAHA